MALDRDSIVREIEEWKRGLRQREEVLAAWDRAGHPGKAVESERYAVGEAKDLIPQYLTEEGEPRTGQEIIDEMKKGGYEKYKKKKDSAIFGLEQNLRFGNVTLIEGGKVVPKDRVKARLKPGVKDRLDTLNALIGLPEWKK